ncbi:hypothetical protein ACGTN9_11325 [Halobacillus sp. MO56]
MHEKYAKYSLLIGLVTFFLCLIIFMAFDSPSPFLGSLVAAFILFEISYYYLFQKYKQKRE